MSTQEIKLAAIADAIRAKEGSSAPIPANDFASRILALKGKSEFAVPLIASAEEGAVITATNGEEIVTGTTGADQQAILLLEKPGEWTINAQLGDAVRGPKTVEVKSGYEVAFSFAESILPEGYTEVKYIESGSNQYIALPVSSYLSKVDLSAYMNSSGWLLGYGDYSTSNGHSIFGIQHYSSTTANQIRFHRAKRSPNASGQELIVPIDSNDVDIFADFVNGQFRVNGTDYTATLTNPTTSKTWYVFAQDYGIAGRMEAKYQINMKLKHMKIFSRYDALLYDFVPGIDSSGVAGLYDLVNNKFYKSATSTPFVAGPEV